MEHEKNINNQIRFLVCNLHLLLIEAVQTPISRLQRRVFAFYFYFFHEIATGFIYNPDFITPSIMANIFMRTYGMETIHG